MSTSGYSGTPLARKLGIKEGYDVYFINLPEHYFMLFDILPEVNVIEDPSVESLDFIHLFCTERAAFEKHALRVKPFLKKNGMLWVSWPKGSSSIPTDLARDPIRNYLLENGLVDVKVCSVDEDWSGLKFMYRIKDRK
ncbi:DUF3052 domain-containing protein [Poritiphilus flavus]|uniref:DUF3052 domain-containing protein n=1 Tax=Poritiphilus flavus TaxID=2697053 RepID=A0A6L9EEN9_9FLAO|nr:DUF3052 domain-containing protein [Poritiphilus flavus]NAS13230.1 DUF3052 domain-containing protein [Poritiphilus flavus]